VGARRPTPRRPGARRPDALAAFYRFRGFAHFIEVYAQVNALVTGADDVEDLVVGLARDLAAGAVRCAEVTVTPVSHIRAGVDPGALADALTAAGSGPAPSTASSSAGSSTRRRLGHPGVGTAPPGTVAPR
jgi:adenosine deaminase